MPFLAYLNVGYKKLRSLAARSRGNNSHLRKVRKRDGKPGNRQRSLSHTPEGVPGDPLWPLYKGLLAANTSDNAKKEHFLPGWELIPHIQIR